MYDFLFLCLYALGLLPTDEPAGAIAKKAIDSDPAALAVIGSVFMRQLIVDWWAQEISLNDLAALSRYAVHYGWRFPKQTWEDEALEEIETAKAEGRIPVIIQPERKECSATGRFRDLYMEIEPDYSMGKLNVRVEVDHSPILFTQVWVGIWLLSASKLAELYLPLAVVGGTEEDWFLEGSKNFELLGVWPLPGDALPVELWIVPHT